MGFSNGFLVASTSSFGSVEVTSLLAFDFTTSFWDGVVSF